MNTYMVTIKLRKNPDHDPHNKKTGVCPANPDKLCTDVTGEHHTFLAFGKSLDTVMVIWSEEMGMHVTRIEEV
jgi:hypothetical protein